MKFSKFDVVVWGAVIVAGLIIIGVLVIGDQVGARAARTYPNDGGSVGGRERIGLEFAQAMQTESVEQRFSIEPPVPGHFVWEGQALWFVPDDLFQRGVRYTARLAAGALAQSGQAMKRDLSWGFSVRPAWVVYTSPSTGARQLWRISSEGGEAAQLTNGSGTVYEFTVSPDGSQIAYAASNSQNGIDLWAMASDGSNGRLLVNCGPDLCFEPAWSPDGQRIAYSFIGSGLVPGSRNTARIWTLDLNTNQTAPLYEDTQMLGNRASWSPEGKRLAFYDSGAGGIRALNLETKQEVVVKTAIGEMGAWSPDGNAMLFNDLQLGETPFIGLYRADLNTGDLTLLLGPESQWEAYAAPALSPDGQWVVLGLRTKDGAGKQLWLMHPDGSEARAITDDKNYTNDSYRWDSWGQAIVFQRIKLDTPEAAPEIMVWPVNGGTPRLLAKDAVSPAWMP
ncbi:MAG: PD40 domain-containing protein [Chloroflexi bacterium]|nr:PD40 domain-containing protein [Chloroflexota bacterium]